MQSVVVEPADVSTTASSSCERVRDAVTGHLGLEAVHESFGHRVIQGVSDRADRGQHAGENVVDRHGRTYPRRRRLLSDTATNAMVTLLGRILPRRTFLEVDEFHALLDTAAELEREPPRGVQGLGRRAMIATLWLAGLRVGELVDQRARPSGSRARVVQTGRRKRPRPARASEITRYLRDELLEYAMDRRARGLPLPSDHFFGIQPRETARPRRFRDRILAVRSSARAQTA